MSKMAVALLPRRRRTLKRTVFFALAALVLLKLILPADNVIFLAIHWNWQRFLSCFRSASGTTNWVLTPGEFPPDFITDVGILIKTGYGTRERLPAQLDALGLREWDPDRVLVVADFANDGNASEGMPVIQDAVGGLMKGMRGRMETAGVSRFRKYMSLRKAIEEKDEMRAMSIGKNVGWELDALKFIWGLGTIYKSLPMKAWYIILDDDSFLINESMGQILSHLDPSKPHYLGNAVGDFKGRFAHGGSAVVLSAAAVEALYQYHPELVTQAEMNSLSETWGDKLIATTLQKLGIFIDERFNHFFNGESPIATRIWSDRFCTPLVSFHELKKPEEMRRLGTKFRDRHEQLTYWGDVWELFDAPEWDSFIERPIRQDWDFVGKLGVDTRTSKGVDSAPRCMRLCMKHRKECLAWTWDSRKKECYTSPWMIVGAAAPGKSSGINGNLATELLGRCKR